MKKESSLAFRRGLRDGVPIALGYFAVAFSLGIVARRAGVNALQGFLTSAVMNASAGEYAAFVCIAADAADEIQANPAVIEAYLGKQKEA